MSGLEAEGLNITSYIMKESLQHRTISLINLTFLIQD